MFGFPSCELVPGPAGAGRAAQGIAHGKTKTVLKCRSCVLLEEKWSRHVLKIENTEPTAQVRQSKNRKGLLKRGVTVRNLSPCGWTMYLRLLVTAARPAPQLAGVPTWVLFTPVLGLLHWSMQPLTAALQAGPCAGSDLSPSPPKGRQKLPGLHMAQSVPLVGTSKSDEHRLSWIRPSSSCLRDLFYSLTNFQ